MFRLFGMVFCCSCALVVAGCGDGGGSVVEDASESDIQSYEEMLAEEEAQGAGNVE